ncbi:MAG TPA: MFS transporter [Candidatus Methanomethylicus sp.]|nr:MFS transporter [Candidatus Methanomethylicus sp.]
MSEPLLRTCPVLNSVTFFFVTVAIFSTGFGIMTPAVPIYAGAIASANALELGLLGAFTAVPYIFLPAVFGKISDRIGRKPPLIGGLLLYAAACVIYAQSTTILQLSILRVLEGVCFSAVWPSAEAFVGDKSDGIGRSALVGMYSVSWSFGYMAGPIVLGLIIPYTDIHNAFYGVALFMAAGASMVAAIRMPQVPKQPSEVAAPTGIGGMPLIICVMIMWGFATLSFLFLFPSYAAIAGLTASLISYLVGITSLVRTLVFIFYRRILSILGRSTIGLGMMALSASMFLSWLAPSAVGFAASVALLGLALGLLYAYSLAFVLNKPAKGFYAGLFESAIGIGELIGPMLMGYIGFISAPSSPYLLLAILAAISAVLTMRAMRGFYRISS